VEIVKKIADEDLQDKDTDEDEPPVEPPVEPLARKRAEFPPLQRPRRMSCKTPHTDGVTGHGKWSAVESV
jgi:hypothetical protein